MKHGIGIIRGNSTSEMLEEIAQSLNKGWQVAKYVPMNDAVFIHLIFPEEGDIEATPIALVIESVIEVAVTTDPEPIRKLTSDGWVIKNLYSKKAQLVKYREEGGEDAEEND